MFASKEFKNLAVQAATAPAGATDDLVKELAKSRPFIEWAKKTKIHNSPAARVQWIQAALRQSREEKE